MRIGVLSDPHLGYSHGTRTLSDGTNVRESDVYNAAYRAVRNLLNAGVDAICDLGDLAHVAHPKKRAIIHLIHLINEADIDWFSCGGNHTAQRTSSDAHLYDLLVDQCPRFHGAFTGPQYFDQIGAYFIPYDTSENIQRALESVPPDAVWIGGHWSCEDADWPGEHVPLSVLPTGIHTLLGHWHTRSKKDRNPIYVGATERFAWGEARNPCGAAVYDTDTGLIEFINHSARQWVDISVTPDNYLEDDYYESVENSIVRVNVVASPEQYHSLHLLQLKQKLAASMEYQVRRVSPDHTAETQKTITKGFSIIESYRERIKQAKIPRGIKRRDVERIGVEALEG